MTDEQKLRAKAKEILEQFFVQFGEISSSNKNKELIITEALKDAYKQGALSRIQLPARKNTNEFEYNSFEEIEAKGFNNCLEEIKITPLSADDLLPNEEKIQAAAAEYADFNDADWVNGAHWVLAFVRARLEGTK